MVKRLAMSENTNEETARQGILDALGGISIGWPHGLRKLPNSWHFLLQPALARYMA
jgi:hypothetical protein